MKYILPDRYEKMINSTKDISGIIIPIKESVERIEEIKDYMESSLGGFFLVLKGKSGEGKTTFLNTLDHHFSSIEIQSISELRSIKEELEKTTETKRDLRIIILEGRESFVETSYKAVESDLHAINKFIRTKNGKDTIVVWPINEDDMLEDLQGIAKRIGGTSLLSNENVLEFEGPPRKKYIKILKDTFKILNQDKDIVEYGISDTIASDVLRDADTIGEYLLKISMLIQKYRKELKKSKEKLEIENVWIVVISSNDPLAEIRALTKGKKALIDHDRILYSTDSNAAQKLRNNNMFPLFIHEINAKLLLIPSNHALDIVKSTEYDKLQDLLKTYGIGISSTCNVDLENSMLGHALSDSKISKKYSQTKCDYDEFKKLTKLASSNDTILNREIGEALKKAGLIYKYETESPLSGLENRRTDLLCNIEGGYVRLEFMWKESASESDIADYTLKKLNAYGNTIGIL